jgi:hypothetical protein
MIAKSIVVFIAFFQWLRCNNDAEADLNGTCGLAKFNFNIERVFVWYSFSISSKKS